MMMITSMMNRLCNQMASRADWDLSHEIATTSVQTCKKPMNYHECSFCLRKNSTKIAKNAYNLHKCQEFAKNA